MVIHAASQNGQASTRVKVRAFNMIGAVGEGYLPRAIRDYIAKAPAVCALQYDVGGRARSVEPS